MYIAAVFFVMNVTKLAYWQARPFWVDSSIIGKECST